MAVMIVLLPVTIISVVVHGSLVGQA